MSITRDFEEEAGYGIEQGFYVTDVLALLSHARALEEMLRKHEWSGDGPWCQECGNHQDDGHSPDCALAKLIGE